MRTSAPLPASLKPFALLALLLAAPAAWGRPALGAHEVPPRAWSRDAPLAARLLPSLEARPDTPAERPPHAAAAPVAPAVWVLHGAVALVPLGGVYGASRLHEERLWVTAAETVAGGAAGSLPGSLLFLQSAEAGGRWAELDVAAFTVGMVLTPPAAALGTWGLGELAFDGSQDRGRAYLGALAGAAAGTLLGVAVHGLLEEVVGNRDTLAALRKYIALGFIGSGATVGYQWGGGGPRERAR